MLAVSQVCNSLEGEGREQGNNVNPAENSFSAILITTLSKVSFVDYHSLEGSVDMSMDHEVQRSGVMGTLPSDSVGPL